MRSFFEFLFSIVLFVLTMLLALFAFTYTAVHYPSVMRDLMTWAQQVRDYVRELALPDSYMVWVDIFMQPSQFVLVGFSIATRIVIGIVFGILGLLFFRGSPPAQAPVQAPPPAAPPSFGRWS